MDDEGWAGGKNLDVLVAHVELPMVGGPDPATEGQPGLCPTEQPTEREVGRSPREISGR